MPEPAKTDIGYRSRNEVLVGTDFGGACCECLRSPRASTSSEANHLPTPILTPTPALMPTLTLDLRRQVLSHRLRIPPRDQVVAPRHPDHRGAGTAQINCTGTGTDHPNCCIIADTCPSHIDKPTLATSPSLATNLSSQAKKVYEIEQTDISAQQYAYHDRGYVHEFQANTVASSFLQRF